MVGVNVVSPGPSGARDGTFSSRLGIAHCSGRLRSQVMIQIFLDVNVKLKMKKGDNTFVICREHSRSAFITEFCGN